MATIKKILVPTDFSENSEAVYNFVNETAKNYEATVDLIYILPEASPFFEATRDPLGNVFKEKRQYGRIRSEFLEKLDGVMETHVKEPFHGKTIVLHNDKPSVAITDFAEKEGYDLIMVASRGRGDSIFSRGSVTEKLIRISSTPILSVNKGYDPDINRILLPTDGSSTSLEALPLALKIAHKNQASIDLLNVYVYESFTARTIGGDTGKYTTGEMKENVLNNLKEFIKNNPKRLAFVEENQNPEETIQIKNADGNTVDLNIRAVKAFSAQASIIEYALSNNQLVVIATRGRGAVSHLFIGSTTEKVARHLKMPVITFKPKPKKD